MQTLPRPARRSRRRTVTVLVACVALSLPVAAISAAHASGHQDPLKKKRHHVHAQVHRAKGDLDSSSRRLRHATARLDAARGELRAAKRDLAGTRHQLRVARQADRAMRARLARAQDRVEQAQQAVRRGKQEVHRQRIAVGRLAAANYQSGSPDLLRLVAVLDPAGPATVATQLNTVRNLMSRESGTLEDLRETEAQLEARETKLSLARRTVARQQAATRATVVRKKRLERSARSQKRQVAELVDSRRQAAGKARRIRAHDRRVLRQLKRQEARIKREILARARHQANRRVGDTGGLLYRPVPGYITSPYGWREHPIYHYWGLHDGDDFHAPCGTPERAAGTGRVIKEYYSSVWGHRLYLDLGRINGHNFTVIYNHISRYAVGTGAHVARGQTVAYAGTTGWSTGCHLHFTVLRDGNAVNPMDYIGG